MVLKSDALGLTMGCTLCLLSMICWLDDEPAMCIAINTCYWTYNFSMTCDTSCRLWTYMPPCSAHLSAATADNLPAIEPLLWLHMLDCACGCMQP